MFSHIMVGSNDIERSKAFYNSVLRVLGAGDPVVNVNKTGQTRLFYSHNGSIFCVTEPINNEPATTANGSTIGFICDSPEQVKDLHDVAVANGGTSIEDPPGIRGTTIGKKYLCYFLDPDGHKICGVYHYD